jgi:Tfp pilus assembly protein PilO
VKAQTKKRTNLVVMAMLVIAAAAAAFWMMLLSPKREEAQKLSDQIESVEASLTQHRSEAAAAAAAKRSFPQDYARLVVLGKAVPAGDETASLLVQLNRLADNAGATFETLTLDGGSEESPVEETAGGAASPTEAEASLLPLGASIGPAGLAVMPYSLTFEGDFFQIASFIESLDDLVKTNNRDVAVKGRLITVGSYSLSPVEDEEEGNGSKLQASFTVTTYLTPPGQGLTAGASAGGPEEVTTLTSSTTGTAP